MRFGMLVAAGIVSFGVAPAAAAPDWRSFEDVCATLSTFDDACGMAQATAEMLSPTYEENKKKDGVRRLEALGYVADYIAAGGGSFDDTTDVFLAARPNSGRIYVVITGTESLRDWYENAKFKPYTTKWKDGYFYTPPGHAGFRSGALNVIAALLKRNEFNRQPLECSEQGEAPANASRLSRFICRSHVRSTPGSQISVVVAGHSRGSGVATLIAPALAGYEIARDGVRADVRRQANWPLEFGGLVGFAPPYAIYTRTDRDAGMTVPDGAPDQWQVYARAGIFDRTMMFFNDRDIVPLLSLGLGRQVGHRFRITESGTIEYLGFNSLNSVSFLQAHSSAGYCHDVLAAFGRPDVENRYCDERTYSEAAVEELLID